MRIFSDSAMDAVFFFRWPKYCGIFIIRDILLTTNQNYNSQCCQSEASSKATISLKKHISNSIPNVSKDTLASLNKKSIYNADLGSLGACAPAQQWASIHKLYL